MAIVGTHGTVAARFFITAGHLGHPYRATAQVITVGASRNDLGGGRSALSAGVRPVCQRSTVPLPHTWLWWLEGRTP